MAEELEPGSRYVHWALPEFGGWNGRCRADGLVVGTDVAPDDLAAREQDHVSQHHDGHLYVPNRNQAAAPGIPSGDPEWDVASIQRLAEMRASLKVWEEQGFIRGGWETPWVNGDACWYAQFTTMDGKSYNLTEAEFEQYEAGWLAGRDFLRR